MLLAFGVVYFGSLVFISVIGGFLGLLIAGDVLAGFEPWVYFLYTGFLAAMLTEVITFRLGYIKEVGNSFLRIPEGGQLTLSQRVTLWFLCAILLAGAGVLAFVLPLLMETQLIETLSAFTSLGFILGGLFLLFYLFS